jgi:endoglucanase
MIIGQGSPSDQRFISLWTQLAKHYATQQKIIFGIMNEPHDLDMTSWARTAQAAVKAIRIAGATSQLILLPGNHWSAASSFVQDSAPAMATVIDADGTTMKLIYDIHQYFDGKDGNGGGNEAACTTDHVSDGFSPLADYLRSYGRQALLSETGGGNTSSCLQCVCSALDFLNANSDVFLGWVGWAAGSFDDSYLANESPQGDTDTSLIRMCLALKFNS